VEKRIIKIREEWRRTRGGHYYYVQEGNTLRHISYYAIKKTKVYESGRGPTIEYEVPVDSLEGKLIYSFKFTNSGYFSPRVGKVDAFLEGKYPEYPWIPNYDLMKTIEPGELSGLEVEVENRSLKQAIQELRTIYLTMINEVKDYENKLNFNVVFGDHAERTSDIYYDLERGLIACLSLPSDEERLLCLEVPMKWIHQLWVMKLICEALNVKEIKKGRWEKQPFWHIEQGRSSPSFIALSDHGVYSFWFEFQPSKEAHMVGLFVKERVPIRPDILVCKGEFEDAKELNKIDLIIECKNKDFRHWQTEIETQVIPYFEVYKPANLILASMKPIPTFYEQRLEDIGIKIVSGLAPNNSVSIEKLMKLVRSLLC
jgi:hypothetical protein